MAEKVLSGTKQAPICKFKGMNSYQNHHGEETMAALARQKLCTTLIGTENEIKNLFACIPVLKCMIDIFHSNFLENLEECGYPLTLKFIDIL